MSVLELAQVSATPLRQLTARFESGTHVVLGQELEGCSTLIELCAGVAAPSSGRITFGGRSLVSQPALRRSTSSLLAEEPPYGAGTLEEWLAQVAALRGAAHADELRRLGFALGVDRPLASLDAGERRTLALALALAHPEARLVALHEPLAAAASLNGERVIERIQELAARAVVLITTRLAPDARRLGGTLYVLERGTLVRSPAHAWPAELTPGLPARLVVDCDAPRELLRELASAGAVSAMSYDGARAPRRVVVQGQELEALALAVQAAVRRAGVTLEALRIAASDLEGVHGASAGLARAAYEAAHAAGQDAWRARAERIPAPPPPAPSSK